MGALPACGVEARRTACAIEGADVGRVALPGGDEVGDLLAGVVARATRVDESVPEGNENRAESQPAAGKSDRLAMSMMNGPTCAG